MFPFPLCSDKPQRRRRRHSARWWSLSEQSEYSYAKLRHSGFEAITRYSGLLTCWVILGCCFLRLSSTRWTNQMTLPLCHNSWVKSSYQQGDDSPGKALMVRRSHRTSWSRATNISATSNFLLFFVCFLFLFLQASQWHATRGSVTRTPPPPLGWDSPLEAAGWSQRPRWEQRGIVGCWVCCCPARRARRWPTRWRSCRCSPRTVCRRSTSAKMVRSHWSSSCSRRIKTFQGWERPPS